jgi:hypothetical protein
MATINTAIAATTQADIGNRSKSTSKKRSGANSSSGPSRTSSKGTAETKQARHADDAPKTAKRGRPTAGGPAAAAKTGSASFREGSKGAAVVGLLGRKDGATLAELAKATGWQNHSVRGFLSGTLKKKHGIGIASGKDADGERRYRIVS